MIRIKGLKPAHKEKKRYLSYQLQSNGQPASHKKFIDYLNEKLGIFMASEAGLQLVLKKEEYGILRMNTSATTYIQALFAMTKKVNDQPVTVKSILLTGVLNKAKKSIGAEPTKNTR